MTLDEYQSTAAETDQFKATDDLTDPGLVAKVFGLAGETGEVSEKFKKVIRDGGGKITPENKMEIAKELGDVLWYIASISRYMGFPLSEVAQMNLDKLQSRLERGKIGGSGDNR